MAFNRGMSRVNPDQPSQVAGPHGRGFAAGLEALEGDWFAPLAEAFRAGRLERLRLSAPSDRGTLELALSASERWKFWRKPYAFDALLKSIAPAPMQIPDTAGPAHGPR